MIEHESTHPDTRYESLNFNSDQSYSNRFRSPISETYSSSNDEFERERVFGWGWSNASDQDLTISEQYLNTRSRQWQPYPSHNEQQLLQLQYQSPGTGHYPCQTTDYPSSYAFPNHEPSMGYAMAGIGYDDDTPSPTPMSTAALHPQQQAPEGPYFCLVEGCNMTTDDAACMLRHVSQVHFRTPAERVDCQWQGCNRVGDYGFSRRDKMIEHMREAHHCDLSKWSAVSASTRKYSAYSGQTQG